MPPRLEGPRLTCEAETATALAGLAPGYPSRIGTGPAGATCGGCRHHVVIMARGRYSGGLEPTRHRHCERAPSPGRRPIAVPHRTPACRLWQAKART